MTSLSIDFETRATVDLKKSGVYPYAMHRDTDVWCMAWAFDDEEPSIWTPSDGPLPARIYDHIAQGGEIRAWNAQFERVIWKYKMVNRGAPIVQDEQWVCSAAEAAAMALPRHLGEAARVLGVEQQKDDEGYRLMLRMTRPRKILADGTIVWWTEPDRLARLFDYCKQDVRTERSIVSRLRRLTAKERAIYLMDQRINDRGVMIDRELIEASQSIVEVGVARANEQIEQLTAGEVYGVTNHGQLRAWVNEQGIEAPSVDKASVRELLDGELPSAVRQVLELRADAGRSSVAKLESMLACACPDDRMRGLLLYHAASTGRWAGKLAQPHNYPRPEHNTPESLIPLILDRDYDALDLVYSPIGAVVDNLRSCMTAGPGNDLIAGDFSAIEARVVNWLAGQHDVLALFAAGEDVYKHNAARLYRIPLSEVQKYPHRQTGKFQELGCGFGMGAKKAVSAAKSVYQLEITEEQAKEIVDNYRSTHDKVVALWYDTERTCKQAIECPGAVLSIGAVDGLKVTKQGAYLYIILPSGRPLCYASPKLVEAKTPWGEMREQIEISAVDPYLHQWGRVRLYGGLLVENITQAVARDVMAEAMLEFERVGYAPVLSVHDEVVCEVPRDWGSLEQFESILTAPPTWARGLPIAGECWRGHRYRK